MRRVPRYIIDLIISSFSCKGSSIENNTRTANGRMIEEGTCETAITFNGTVDYMVNSTAKCGISENVEGLLRKFGAADSDGDADGESESAVSDSDATDEAPDEEAHHQQLSLDGDQAAPHRNATTICVVNGEWRGLPDPSPAEP